MGSMKDLVAIYVRKSRIKNDDEMEISRQIELLTDYAKSNNFDYEIFHEEGSSEDWNRIELQRMFSELKGNLFSGVLVTDQDRITRDSTDMGLFKRKCREYGLLFHTLNKSYDFMNDDDNLITGIQAEVDSHQMRTTKRKMMRGRIQALKQGVYFGIPPYGYDKSRQRPKILVVDPEESKVIKSIFDMYVNKKLNQKEIVENLLLLGIKSRKGVDFSVSQIAFILSNIVYTGTLFYELKGKEPIIVEDAHELIVAKKLYEEAQLIRSERRTVPQSAKKGKYTLSRLIKCTNCGTTLSFSNSYKSSTREGGKDLFVLNCYASTGARKKRELKERCTNNGVRASRIEEFVFKELRVRLQELDDEIDILLEDGNKILDEFQVEIEQIDKRLSQLEIQKKRVQDGYRDGIYDSVESKVELKKINEFKTKLELRKEKLESTDVSTEIEKKNKTKESILILLSEESNDTTVSNALLRDIVEHVNYYKEKPDYNGKETPMTVIIRYKE